MSDEHGHVKVNYLAIFILLCICTLLSAAFDVMKSSMTYPVLVSLVMAVAVCKATFVLLYFMHVRFETAWKYVLLTPTLVLALALPFALAPDMSFHYYNVIVEQSYVMAGDSHHGAGHGVNHAEKHEASPDHAGDSKDAHHHEDGHSEAKQEADHKHHPDQEHKPGSNKASANTDHPKSEKPSDK